MTQTTPVAQSGGIDARARTFVDARLSGGCVSVYPGAKPVTLSEAYDIQDDAISLFPEKVCGWKVGRIMGAFENQLGINRLAGPVFENVCRMNSSGIHEMPVFEKGFAAVEGEVTAVIAKDVPQDKTDFTTEDALGFIEALHFGVEIASSPFPEINDHGPLVTISDFGNNYGLILGGVIPDWRAMKVEDWMFETVINGKTVGRANPSALPGGPVESVRFLLENTARRSLPVRKGMSILTGAVTGVHQAFAGDEAFVTLGNQKISVLLSTFHG